MPVEESHLGTQAVHAGEPRQGAFHSVTVPIVQTSTYSFANTAELVEYLEERMFADQPLREEYGRYGNPTVRAVEAKLAALEGGDDALLFSSGMAAVSGVCLSLLRQGDHIVVLGETYDGTRALCENLLVRFGVQSTVCPPCDLTALTQALRPNTRVIWFEVPSNPFQRVPDLRAVVTLAREHKLKTVMDATFATPVNLRPLEYGVDIVLHSATKYFSGHNDLMAGAVIGRDGAIAPVRATQKLLGSILDPHGAYLLLRGLKTLDVRMKRHNENGLAVAQALADHPAVKQVWYPLLRSHPDCDAATQLLAGGGGVVTFELADGPSASRFCDSLKLGRIAASLGGVETLVQQPAILVYYDADPAEREALGMRDGLIRLACGIEDTRDLVQDVLGALGG